MRLRRKGKQTEEECIQAVRYDSLQLQYVKHQTKAICEAAIQHSGLAIQFVKDKTHDLCFAAVKKDGTALRYISDASEDIQLKALKQNGLALEFIQNPTDAMIRTAIRENSYAISLVRNASPELFLYAFEYRCFKPERRDKDGGYCVQFQDPQTKEVCLAAVRQNGMNLKYVLPPLKADLDIIRAALEQQPYAFQWVLSEHKTQSLCWEAVEKEKYCLKWVPHEFQTEEMVFQCVEHEDVMMFAEYINKPHFSERVIDRMLQTYPDTFMYLSPELQTVAICENVIGQKGYLLRYVREDLQSDALLEIAIRNEPDVLEYIPIQRRSKLLCELVAEKGRLEHVPRRLRSPDLCKKAVAVNARAIIHIPRITKEILLIAIERCPGIYVTLPKRFRTEELALEAVKRQGSLLEDRKVPQTEPICLAAVRDSWRAYMYVKEKTQAIQLAAVKAHWQLLEIIEDQTEEMCIAAVQQSRDALIHCKVVNERIYNLACAKEFVQEPNV